MSQPPVSISHVCACVSDLDRSVAFYGAVLGFELAMTTELGAPFHTILEFTELKARGAFLSHPTMNIRFELIEFETPETLGPAGRRPMNQLGFTHMALAVEDLMATAERIVAHGGEVHWHTRVTSHVGDLLFANDPDGVRLELWQKPA